MDVQVDAPADAKVRVQVIVIVEVIIKKFEQQQNCEVLFAYYIGDRATQEIGRARGIDILCITTGDTINVKIDSIDIWAVNIYQTLSQKFIFPNPQHIMLLNNNVIYSKDGSLIDFIHQYKDDLFDEFKQAIAYDIVHKYKPLCQEINKFNIDSKMRYRQWLYEIVFSIFIINHFNCELNNKEKKILCDIRGKYGYLMPYEDIEKYIVYNKNMEEPYTPLSYKLLEKIGDSMDNKIFANRYKVLLKLYKKDYNFDNTLMYTNSSVDEADNFEYLNRCIKILFDTIGRENEIFWAVLDKVYNLIYNNHIFQHIGKIYLFKCYDELPSLINEVLKIEDMTQKKAFALNVLKLAIKDETVVGNEEELNKLLHLIENDEVVKYQYDIW